MHKCPDCRNPNCPKCGTTHFISECVMTDQQIKENWERKQKKEKKNSE